MDLTLPTWPRILAIPELSDPEQLRAARLLRVTLVVLIGVVVANAAVLMLLGAYRKELALYLIPMLGAAVALRFLSSGRVRFVAAGFTVSMFLLVSYATATFGGLRSGNTINTYTLLIILAGMLWSVRAGIVVAVLAGVTTMGIGLVQAYGTLPTLVPIEEQSLPAVWAGFMVNIVLVTLVMWATLRSVRAATAEVRDSKDRLAELVRESPDGIIALDASDAISSANPVACRLIGRTSEELVGEPLTAAPALADREQELLSEALRGTRRNPPAGPLELHFGSDGEVPTPVHVIVRSFEREDGSQGTQVTLRDLSDLKRSERERAGLEERLRQAQKMEAIGRLAGGIAHDFNNVLTVILGYGQDVLDRVKGHPDLHEDLTLIQDAAERGASLTGQLLAFSRQQPLDAKPLDLNASVLKTERMLNRVLGDEIELSVDLAPDLSRVHADASQVDQVLVNLVVNARDAMPDGGIVTIATRNEETDAPELAGVELDAGDYVRLSVTDSGLGMPPEIRDRVFDPFFTTKAAGKGTGLGLSTVYGIVTQSGGNVRISNPSEGGTRFDVWLPHAAAGTATPVDVQPAASGRMSGTILVVEDEDPVRRLVRSILSARGYTVLEAENGRAALQLCESRTDAIDLLLTDLRMPELDGYGLIRQFRDIYPDSRILVMSGYSSEAPPVADIGFVSKPFTPRELAKRVQEVLPAPTGRIGRGPEEPSGH